MLAIKFTIHLETTNNELNITNGDYVYFLLPGNANITQAEINSKGYAFFNGVDKDYDNKEINLQISGKILDDYYQLDTVITIHDENVYTIFLYEKNKLSFSVKLKDEDNENLEVPPNNVLYFEIDNRQIVSNIGNNGDVKFKDLNEKYANESVNFYIKGDLLNKYRQIDDSKSYTLKNNARFIIPLFKIPPPPEKMIIVSGEVKGCLENCEVYCGQYNTCPDKNGYFELKMPKSKLNNNGVDIYAKCLRHKNTKEDKAKIYSGTLYGVEFYLNCNS